MNHDLLVRTFHRDNSRNARSGRHVLIRALARALMLMSFVAGVLPAAAAPLPKMGHAPEFRLTNQDGEDFALRKLRGRVAVVTFIFTSCSDTCPLLTAKLLSIQRKLGHDTPKVFFVAISVDPLHDSPDVLKNYAKAYSAPPEHFAFLTGNFDKIQQVVRSYGVYFEQKAERDVDHTFLTSIVDRSGALRVQYMGWRFDPEEFLGDLRSIVREGNQS